MIKKILKPTACFLLFIMFTSCAVITKPTLELEKPLDPNIDINPNPSPDPIIEPFYYGRSLLSKNNQKAYDFILSQIWTWENNAEELGGIAPLKFISLQDQGIKITRDKLSLLLMYMRNDVPALYTQHPPAREIITDGQGYVRNFKYRHFNFPKYTEYQKEMEQINKKADEIISQMPKDLTDAQKVRFIHDHLLMLVSYGGMSNSSAGDIRGAFIAFKIICDGYAQALLFLLQKIGIEAVYIVGDTPQGLHAWNKVKIEGTWYNVDPTWNDSMVSSSTAVFHNYFLMGDTEFNINHTPHSGALDYPMPASSLTNYPFEKTEY